MDNFIENTSKLTPVERKPKDISCHRIKEKVIKKHHTLTVS